MSVRASIAQYICTQRASVTLATMVIADPPDDSFLVFTREGHTLYAVELPSSSHFLGLDICRAAMANVRPHVIPGVFPWR